MWQFIIQLVIALAIGYYMQPEPPDAPKAATLEELDIPSNDDGRPVAVVFGTVHIRSANVCWYGDLRTVPIQKEVG